MTDIKEDQTIWFPGIYHGRDTEEYTVRVSYVSDTRLVELVQLRAAEDGEWAIANGHVGENNESEPKLRRMMAFVSDEKNIRQCLEHIKDKDETGLRTVDWVCRELANASKYMVS